MQPGRNLWRGHTPEKWIRVVNKSKNQWQCLGTLVKEITGRNQSEQGWLNQSLYMKAQWLVWNLIFCFITVTPSWQMVLQEKGGPQVNLNTSSTFKFQMWGERKRQYFEFFLLNHTQVEQQMYSSVITVNSSPLDVFNAAVLESVVPCQALYGCYTTSRFSSAGIEKCFQSFGLLKKWLALCRYASFISVWYNSQMRVVDMRWET